MSLVNANSLFVSLWTGIVQVISFLIGPIVLIYTYNVYTELVKIKK